MYTSTNNRQASVRDSLAGSDQLAVQVSSDEKLMKNLEQRCAVFLYSQANSAVT